MSKSVIDASAFLRIVEDEFDGQLAEPLRLETRFKDLGEWNSLQALIVVAALERDYGVTLSARELAAADTVQDLYQAVVGHLPD
jgi:acyl carrier protein